MGAILANWKAIGISVIVIALLAFLHHYDVLAQQAATTRALAAQQSADVTACNTDKATTKETNDALQKDRDDIAGKLAAYKLHQPSSCVHVAGHTNLPGTGAGHAAENGISTDWLRDYAAEAEGYRRELISCTGFIDQVWKANNQQ